MDLLKRNFAPIGAKAWELIDEQAKRALAPQLSARKFVDVKGPFGPGAGAVFAGRIAVPEGQKKEGVRYGIAQVQPYLEARIAFELDLWELDNAERGAKDVELAPLDEAARKIAAFEEKAIYEGFDEACIAGLARFGQQQAVELSLGKAKDILVGVSRGARKLATETVEGPYALVGGDRLFEAIDAKSDVYPVRKMLEPVIGPNLVYAPHVEGAFLVSLRGGDFELHLGQDLSVGFERAEGNKVRLFLTESFAFRVVEPRAVVAFLLK